MLIYRVHLGARPSRGSEEFGQVGGANIDTFVQARSIEEAMQKAIAHVLGRKWVVTTQDLAVLMTDERIALLDTPGAQTLDLARREGLHSLWIGWPPQDRDDDQVELRPLRDRDSTDPHRH